jgi:hypothetical protein
MDIYKYADQRALLTLIKILAPYHQALTDTTSIKQITQVIIKHLPPSIAHNTELRVKMIRGQDILFKKEKTREIANDLIVSQICKELPAIYNQDGNREIYYIREDIINWYYSDPYNAKYLPPPEEENILIEIHHENNVKRSTMKLTEDQLIGIAYGLNAFADNKIILHSSIFLDPLDIKDITSHALIYKLPITLATEQLKRPFQVDILQPDTSFLTIHFITPQFMQGVLSVAQWYHLPNNGKNILWKIYSNLHVKDLFHLISKKKQTSVYHKDV